LAEVREGLRQGAAVGLLPTHDDFRSLYAARRSGCGRPVAADNRLYHLSKRRLGLAFVGLLTSIRLSLLDIRVGTAVLDHPMAGCEHPRKGVKKSQDGP